MHPADPRVALLRDHLVGHVLLGSAGVRFHVRELLGEGGQGWIYKGNYDEPDGIPIVIKVLRPDGATDETLHRFQREASVLRKFGSQANPNPNLVRFYDHGTVSLSPPKASPLDKVTLPFTVLEYVPGVTLADLIHEHRGAGLSPARTRRLMRQVASALTFVHAQSIIHRDLKPSNILVAVEQGTDIVKVTDFGLAKLTSLSVQKTAMVAGASLGYAPPEQYEEGNERVGPRTDVFSFATILFECLAGKQAFPFRPGDNALIMINEMVTGPRPTLARLVHALSPELQQNPLLVTELDVRLGQAMQANPEPRPASVREFWDGVDPLLRAASETSVRPSSPGNRSAAPPAEVTGSPRYVFRKVGALTPQYEDELRSAVLALDGKTAFALGARGLYRWLGATWAPVALPAWVDPSRLRGIAALPDSGLLVFGDAATVVALDEGRAAHPWHLPSEGDIDLYGALVDRVGVVLVGGRRPRAKGVFIEAPFGRPPTTRTIETTSTLRAVARLAGGALLACGDDGTLARIDLPTSAAIPWERSGHLLAMAARADGGAFAVGTGGHALSVSPNLKATIEPVQTTRDLITVAVAKDGSAWAGATEQRLVTRRATTWVRVHLDMDISDKTRIVAVYPLSDSVMVVTSDGQVLEGRASG